MPAENRCAPQRACQNSVARPAIENTENIFSICNMQGAIHSAPSPHQDFPRALVAAPEIRAPKNPYSPNRTPPQLPCARSRSKVECREACEYGEYLAREPQPEPKNSFPQGCVYEQYPGVRGEEFEPRATQTKSSHSSTPNSLRAPKPRDFRFSN